MRRRKVSAPKHGASDIDEALAAMGADDLRAIIHGILPWLDGENRARLVNAIIDRGARSGSGWTPETPSRRVISEILAFVEAAKRVGCADPEEVDAYLRQASNAFLGKDYGTALAIFRTLLVPIADVEIDLGQHEMVEEVLGTDLTACVRQFAVAAYMTADSQQRARAVHSAIGEMEGIGGFWEPIRELESAAVEPLPDFDGFLPQWRRLLEATVDEKRPEHWDTREDSWAREVVQRLEGAEGLARIARSTRRAGDLRVWCDHLVGTGDWKSVLRAYKEAAETVADPTHWAAGFLDGAALAAQELGRKDLPKRLELAWRAEPTMLRLRRWLGAARSKAGIRKRAGEALEACPEEVARQRALLHVLVGDLEPAAKLLTAAPGLGWSSDEHPGHLLVPVFYRLLGGGDLEGYPDASMDTDDWADLDELNLDELGPGDPEAGKPRLAAPGASELLEGAGVGGPVTDGDRQAMLTAMRKAAERRLDGVTGKKRRRYYWHGAQLIAACVALDDGASTARWMGRVREKYRRYPALQGEFRTYLGE